ncbi:hypothetical protein D9M72_389110 [compost metagenome]
MVVVQQGCVGLGVVVQVVGEAIEQFGGSVVVQALGFAGVLHGELCPTAADQLHQLLLASLQADDQLRGIGFAAEAVTQGREQAGHLGQARLQGLQNRAALLRTIVGASSAGERRRLRAFASRARSYHQSLQQLVQGVETGGEHHELVVQPRQTPAAHAHVRIFEGGGAAHVLQTNRGGGEARSAGVEARGIQAASQPFAGKGGEVAEASVQGVAQVGTGGLRQDQAIDQAGAENAQADFQHPPEREHEGIIGVSRGRQADHHRRVAGQHAGIAAEVAIARGAGGTQADPDRQAKHEQHPFLVEQGDQHHHYRQPQQGADDAVEALGQDLPALRLHDDEHGHQHGARLWQFQAIGQPECEEGGEQGLEDEGPGQAITARPVSQCAVEGLNHEGISGLREKAQARFLRCQAGIGRAARLGQHATTEG